MVGCTVEPSQLQGGEHVGRESDDLQITKFVVSTGTEVCLCRCRDECWFYYQLRIDVVTKYRPRHFRLNLSPTT